MKSGKAIQTGVIMCAGKEDSVYKKCLSGESGESAESVVSVTSDEVCIMSSLSLSHTHTHTHTHTDYKNSNDKDFCNHIFLQLCTLDPGDKDKEENK